MCCFSGPVKKVSATNIFARMAGSGRQLVVYSMTINMAKPVAMVLPLPVKKGSDEKAARFIDLEKYQNFFNDLDAGFPKPIMNDGLPMPLSAGAAFVTKKQLEVIQVGNFEASFVPTVKDFNRLDKRFQLPKELFAKMPGYKHFGFAVFKLKPGAQTVHPMAFEFPTSSEKIFFPTVHIHDGKVHARATFDHVLYCQPGGLMHLKLSDWEESEKLAASFVDVKKSKSIVVADEHCYKREMHGLLANQDTFVELSA